MTWSMASGNLPVGLTLTGGDTIFGVPTASGTFDFAFKAENITGSDTQDLSITISKTLLSITIPAAITGVANGTEKTAAALGLPAAVSLITAEGNVSGSVTWDVASSSYDPADTAEQTFVVDGTVSLPSGVVNPDGVFLDVSINVTVLAAVSTDKVLISVTTPSAITGVANGAEKTALALGLPATVTLMTDEGNVSGNVTWDVSTSSYDPADTNEQIFMVNGTIILPSGVINPDGVSLDVIVSVTVLAAVSTEKTLISITPPTAAITGVANGTEKTASALGLPATVILVTDGGEVSGDVTWNVASSTYNPSSGSEQTFTVNGTVSLPSGVINPASVPLNVTISVTVKARSGGGGGSGGGSTPDDQNYTVDVEVKDVAGNGTKKTTLPVTVDKTAGSAVVDIGNLFLEVGTSVINLPSMPGIDTYSFGIPVQSLSSLDGQGALTLHTDLGSITVPADMLSGVKNVDGSKVQITIGQGDPSALSETVRTAIGNHSSNLPCRWTESRLRGTIRTRRSR
ncbi:hypothetical protein [Desulfosporosinus hippei]|nr:hypothetical protein [Desulfosporosinus hippei]